MSVAGAMAGSCVSLMKHWEGCCLFQGSGGSLACQDAPPGRRGSCQRLLGPGHRDLPLDCHPQPFLGLPPSAQHVCLLPFHLSPACLVPCPQTCPPPKAPAPSQGSHPCPTPVSEDPVLAPRSVLPSPVLGCQDGCPFLFIACLGYGGCLIGVLNLLP